MFCHKCGTENKDEARFCRACGESLQLAPAQTQPAPSAVATPAWSKLRWIVPGILLVCGLAAGGYWYATRQPQATASQPATEPAPAAPLLEDITLPPQLPEVPAVPGEKPEADQPEAARQPAAPAEAAMPTKQTVTEPARQKEFTARTVFADGSPGPMLHAGSEKDLAKMQQKWDNPPQACDKVFCWAPDRNFCGKGKLAIVVRTNGGYKRIPPACVPSEAEAERVARAYADKHGIALSSRGPQAEAKPQEPAALPTGSAEPAQKADGYKLKFKGAFGMVVEKRTYPTEEMKRRAQDLWDRERKILEPDGSINEKYVIKQQSTGVFPGH